MIMEAEVGMLVVETIAKIRRAFFGQGKSIKAICRELRVSRKVVRKVIRSKATEFRYEREATYSEGWSVPGQAQSTTAGNAGKASRESLTLKRPVWIALRTRTFPQVRRGQGVVATRLRSPAWVWLLLTAVDLSLCRGRH